MYAITITVTIQPLYNEVFCIVCMTQSSAEEGEISCGWVLLQLYEQKGTQVANKFVLAAHCTWC